MKDKFVAEMRAVVKDLQAAKAKLAALRTECEKAEEAYATAEWIGYEIAELTGLICKYNDMINLNEKGLPGEEL